MKPKKKKRALPEKHRETKTEADSISRLLLNRQKAQSCGLA
jgi:hypothetical protein